MENIELVYFVYPSCDGGCEHCWSSDMLMGRYKNFDWHCKVIEKLAELNTYSLIKLSGGEPFKNKELGKIAEQIHKKIGSDVPIQIFTSGRPFVSMKDGEEGVLETKKMLDTYFSNYDNISIQLSVDEYHLKVLKRLHSSKANEEDLVYNYIQNFMQACFVLMKEHPGFLGPKLKIHCEEGHLELHKKLFSWFPEEWWRDYVILTEGLVYAGNAKCLERTFKIQPSNMLSYFLMPGVGFFDEPQTKRALKFSNQEKNIYLDDMDDSAILIHGWWNLINRDAEYTSIHLDEEIYV